MRSHHRLSRRQLLQQGLVVAMAARPVLASGQGTCGDARPLCDSTPAPLPFQPTGWKTVRLDHFSMRVADYRKEAAFFAALMNWTIRSDDGRRAVLDISDWGSIEIRGGSTPPRDSPVALIDSFCWGIEPWEAKTVEAELRKRRLMPVADHDASSNFESFHIKDADGFALQLSNGKQDRRRELTAGRSAAPQPFPSTTWKTVWLDHISFETSRYKEQVAFYQALLGWKPGVDDGRENQVRIGDVGDAIIRGGDAGPRHAAIGHLAFGITPFDADTVKAALDARGLPGWVDTGGSGDIHETLYKSYHTQTPNGFDLQISNSSQTTRGA